MLNSDNCKLSLKNFEYSYAMIKMYERYQDKEFCQLFLQTQ